MSNGSGDLSSVWSSIRSISVDISGLESKINSVNSSSIKRDDKIGKEIKKLQEELSAMRRALTELITQVEESFRSLDSSVSELINKTDISNTKLDEGNIDRKEGHIKIEGAVSTMEESSRRGLQKVSSGVAMVDVLKAMSNSQEAATSISRALEEIQTRYDQAEGAVQEKKEVFDEHYFETLKGYKKQIELVGQHIVQLINKLTPILNELQLDEKESEKVKKTLQNVHSVVTEQRSRILREEYKKIDLKRLAQYRDLRNKLKAFISDDSVVRYEQDPKSKDTELPVFDLPVNAVLLEENNFIPETQGLFNIFCLNAPASDCYNKPVPEIEYAELTKSIQVNCSHLDPDKGVELDKQTIENIKNGLVNLVEKDLIKENHAEMIKKHLDQHPVMWMEF